MRETEDSLWRPHAGAFAWPTVALASTVVALVATAWSGALPLWLSSVMATIAAYIAFTVMHEACHGNVHGRHRRLRWVGTVLGWVCSVTLFAPYPAFRVLHLRHHSRTNHPEDDPDYFVAGSARTVLFRCAKTIPAYYREFLFGRTARSRAGRNERPVVLGALAVYLLTAVVLSALGFWREVLALWLTPAFAASILLALCFDYLPHHPHESRERYRDTRNLDSRLLDVLFIGQNLHLMHHLFPRVPFYRYRAVLEGGRAHFRAKGADLGGRRRDQREARRRASSAPMRRM